MSLTSFQNALERPEMNLIFPQVELLIITASNCIPKVFNKTVIIRRGRNAVPVYLVVLDGTTHSRKYVRAIIGSWSVQMPAGRTTG